ncbi:MAG: hypothetical protein WCA29_00595, partial [Jiangellales bacterium]
MSPHARESSNPQMKAWLARIGAVIELMAGNLDAAFDAALAAIQADPHGLNTVLALANAGQAALWMGDQARLQQVVTSGQNGRGFMADAVGRVIQALEAGLAAVQGHHEQAALAYDSLLATRLSTGNRFAHAVLTVDAISVLPPGLVPEGAI